MEIHLPCFLDPVSSHRLNFALKGSISAKLIIPAIFPCLGLDMSKDCSLCLVRALKVYLGKTGSSARTRSFSSYLQDGLKGDLYTNSLSVWVRKLIHHVFQTAEGEVLPLPNARTHEVCLWQLHWVSGAAQTQMSFCQPAWASLSQLLRLLSLGHRPSDRRPSPPWTYSHYSMLFMLQDSQ